MKWALMLNYKSSLPGLKMQKNSKERPLPVRWTCKVFSPAINALSRDYGEEDMAKVSREFKAQLG